jgi:riboflavin kinase/FMN adenylyltransferase
MRILTSFEELPATPMAFAIGTFDGLHLGHQAIFSKLRTYGVPTCFLTFTEHPLKTLRPNEAPTEITPLPLKLLLLKTDFCLLLEFTKELASSSYGEFLDRLPASHLVLGKGSFFGRRREGTEPNVCAWAKGKGVCVEYIDKLPGISSTEIRNAIQAGDLSKAEKLLGRPHLLFAPSQRFEAMNLALPPDGVYPLCKNTAVIKNRIIELASPLLSPVVKPTIFSFNPNEEFHV